jgi:alpha-galactosidase
MPKLAVIGAGSFVFARRLITDMLTFPSLRDSEISLMDVNEEKLATMTRLAQRMVEQEKTDARVSGTTDLAEACEGADYIATAIRVGEGWDNVSIPAKYGIDYAIGDTSGIAGVFYFLRNAGAILEIARTIGDVAPEGLLLNYTNPMTMLSRAVLDTTPIGYVGLCHSVQGTAQNLAEYLGVPFEDVSYKVAGINHMAWFLDFRYQGRDAYPLLWEAMEKPDVYERDIVRWEMMRHFGAFVTESSIHNSEYNPHFRRTPEMIDRYTDEKMWGVMPKSWTREDRLAHFMEMREKQEAENRELADGKGKIPVERSHEYFSRILNAIETNDPYVFNGNVRNDGVISNLPSESVVEVPIVADGTGLHPCSIGALPPVLAAYDERNLQVQELGVRGYLEKDREYIYHAAMMDPLVASRLELAEIRKLVDEMMESVAEYVSF